MSKAKRGAPTRAKKPSLFTGRFRCTHAEIKRWAKKRIRLGYPSMSAMIRAALVGLNKRYQENRE